MPTQDPTTNYGWNLPNVGGDVGAWGGLLNSILGDDATGIDPIVKGVSNVANAALPKAGGTMTGAIVPNADNTLAFGSAGARWSHVYAALLTGTLQTAAQPNITSLGTLTGLGVSGLLTGRLANFNADTSVAAGAYTAIDFTAHPNGSLFELIAQLEDGEIAGVVTKHPTSGVIRWRATLTHAYMSVTVSGQEVRIQNDAGSTFTIRTTYLRLK